MKIKNEPISNLVIENHLKKYRQFRGVYAHNMLPKKIKAFECGVVNYNALFIIY